MLGEGVELPLPEDPVACDPEGGIFHRPPNETAPVDPAVSLPGQKPGALENAEVLRDGGERHGEGLGQLRHGGLAARQPREDRPAGRVRQGRKRRVEGAGLILNGRTPVKHEIRKGTLQCDFCRLHRLNGEQMSCSGGPVVPTPTLAGKHLGSRSGASKDAPAVSSIRLLDTRHASRRTVHRRAVSDGPGTRIRTAW